MKKSKMNTIEIGANLNVSSIIKYGQKIKRHLKKIEMTTKLVLLDMKADKECRQLEIISNSLMKRFNINEIDALTIGLDVLDDLKKGGLL